MRHSAALPTSSQYSWSRSTVSPSLSDQLEPVAAGHPVAGPVMEILVRDHPLDRRVIVVGRGLRTRQHQAGVEDVEPLVLHRPHVEVRHRGDVEGVEIVFEAEGLLVPQHRPTARGHRVVAAPLIAGPHPDRQCHVTARTRPKRAAHRHEVAGNQREQVARLGMRVLEARPVPPRLTVSGLDQVAVRQQHRHRARARRPASRCSAPSRPAGRGSS